MDLRLLILVGFANLAFAWPTNGPLSHLLLHGAKNKDADGELEGWQVEKLRDFLPFYGLHRFAKEHEVDDHRTSAHHVKDLLVEDALHGYPHLVDRHHAYPHYSEDVHAFDHHADDVREYSRRVDALHHYPRHLGDLLNYPRHVEDVHAFDHHTDDLREYSRRVDALHHYPRNLGDLLHYPRHVEDVHAFDHHADDLREYSRRVDALHHYPRHVDDLLHYPRHVEDVHAFDHHADDLREYSRRVDALHHYPRHVDDLHHYPRHVDDVHVDVLNVDDVHVDNEVFNAEAWHHPGRYFWWKQVEATRKLNEEKARRLTLQKRYDNLHHYVDHSLDDNVHHVADLHHDVAYPHSLGAWHEPGMNFWWRQLGAIKHLRQEDERRHALTRSFDEYRHRVAAARAHHEKVDELNRYHMMLRLHDQAHKEEDFANMMRSFADKKKQYVFTVLFELMKFCKCKESLVNLNKFFNPDTDLIYHFHHGNNSDILDIDGHAPFLHPRTPEEAKKMFLKGLMKTLCLGAKQYVQHVKRIAAHHLAHHFTVDALHHVGTGLGMGNIMGTGMGTGMGTNMGTGMGTNMGTGTGSSFTSVDNRELEDVMDSYQTYDLGGSQTRHDYY